MIERLGAQVIAYAVAAVLVLFFGWWAWSSVVDAIRAPVVAETKKAIDANDSLKADNERLVLQNTKLSDALVRRSKFEAKVDTRLGALEGRLKELKATDPEVKAWAETRIPAKVLQ